MKVAVFFTFDYSLKTWDSSGTLDREFKIYQKICEKNAIDFIFFTYGDNSDLKLAENYPEFKIYPLYSKLKYSNNKLKRFLQSFCIPFVYRKELKEIDILHQHQLLGSWVAMFTKVIYKLPFLLRTGYDMANFARQNNKSIFIIKNYDMLTFLSIKFSDLITVSNKTDYERLKKYSNLNKNNKIVVRSNWVEITASEINLKSRHMNKILSVGRLEDQKNYKLLINELSNMENKMALDIVGEGSLKTNLTSLAKSKNVEINFLGNLAFNELMSLYKKYTFYISTSKFEGNPKTLLEAMGSGCIVIASNIPNHKELISDGKDGRLFNLQNPDIKNLLLELTKSKEYMENISTAASHRISNNNNIDKLANLMVKDYQNLIN